jgi:hypothetical protein
MSTSARRAAADAFKSMLMLLAIAAAVGVCAVAASSGFSANPTWERGTAAAVLYVVGWACIFFAGWRACEWSDLR